jgi:hypothetical protein
MKMKKTIHIIHQDIQPLDWELNLGPSKFNVGVKIIEPQCSQGECVEMNTVTYSGYELII